MPVAAKHPRSSCGQRTVSVALSPTQSVRRALGDTPDSVFMAGAFKATIALAIIFAILAGAYAEPSGTRILMWSCGLFLKHLFWAIFLGS